jgi:hypothetical protein
VTKERPFKLTFSFITDKAKIEVLRILNRKQPLTIDELKAIILNDVMNQVEFQEQLKVSIEHFIMELLKDELIKGEWREKKERLIKEYSIVGGKKSE